MANLQESLKSQIIEALKLEDVRPADIEDDTPLFGEGLGLDSIDALELIVILERNYGIKVKSAEDGQKIFHSINTIAEFIEKEKTN